jgi:arylsulfatase A-like enzyme
MLVGGMLACEAPRTARDAPAADTGMVETLGLALPALRGVVFLNIDTLRADHLGAYGYVRATTPLLDARDWLVVDGLRATSSWTMPSTASLLTSLEPQRHGLTWASTPQDMPVLDGVTTWPQRLAEAGWETGMFTGNVWASDQDGLDAGFATTTLVERMQDERTNFGGLAEGTLTWLDGLDPEAPFFAFLQPTGTHGPYDPDEDDLAAFRTADIPVQESAQGGWETDAFNTTWYVASEAQRPAIEEAAVDLYDATILGLDGDVAGLLDALDERGRLAETLVVLTSDHGEALGEVGRFGHPDGWREELSRVPWMMLHSSLSPGRKGCLSSVVDVFPSLASALGLQPEVGVDGLDLATGCRAVARGELWGLDGTLADLGAATEEAALKRSCDEPGEGGTPIGFGADVTESTPAAELEGGDALQAALDALAADVAAEVGGAVCDG